jgi:hypothetical protein
MSAERLNIAIGCKKCPIVRVCPEEHAAVGQGQLDSSLIRCHPTSEGKS